MGKQNHNAILLNLLTKIALQIATLRLAGQVVIVKLISLICSVKKKQS